MCLARARSNRNREGAGCTASSRASYRLSLGCSVGNVCRQLGRPPVRAAVSSQIASQRRGAAG
jgi:hypothetical protein